jgi:hypothetical protein
MNCQRCNSERILSAGGKCSDCFGASIGKTEITGYVPNDLAIGGGDYIEFNLCLDCGQLQNKFPLPLSKMEHKPDEKEVEMFFEESFNEGEYFNSINIKRRTRILNDANDIGISLLNYIDEMFGFYCDSDVKVPDMATFVSMYKEDLYEL